MLETQEKQEQVLIVGVQTNDYTDEKFVMLMKEMHALTETAGGNPVVQIVQKLERPNSKTLVGKGKLEEVKLAVEHHDIDLVITLNPLTPSVNRMMEEALQVRVIDRIQLILDIFAMRAKSREGKLQVELAQYQYLLPRLQGQNQHLSRLGAGIGTRGPGETKLETDRRHIRHLMNTIKKELAHLSTHRERTRLRRRSGKEYNIGLVGYTNAGKSTLLSQLTNTQTYVQDQLFATLDPLTRQMTINGHDSFTLTDTVGFIEALPTELVEAFLSTLEEMRYVDLLLHVVDASSSQRLVQEQTVLQLINQLDMTHIPILTVYNKVDKIEKDKFAPTLFPSIVISAHNLEDVEHLKDRIWEEIVKLSDNFEVDIQASEADLLALYRQKTLVQSIDFDEEKQVYRLKGVRRKESGYEKEI